MIAFVLLLLLVPSAAGQDGCYGPGGCVKSNVDQNWYKWDTDAMTDALDPDPFTQSIKYDMACDDTGLGATSFENGYDGTKVGESIAFPDNSWIIGFDAKDAILEETTQDKEAVYLDQGEDKFANRKAVLCVCTPCEPSSKSKLSTEAIIGITIGVLFIVITIGFIYRKLLTTGEELIQ